MEIKYDLELEKAIEKIKKENAKLVCIQLPDGLKEKATEIAKVLEEQTNCTVIIWLGSAWGACDIPVLDVDLLIQWGHSEWDAL
ncbi:MAG: diphthamide synthesis protein [Nanoarchaeota archaeon]